MKNFYFIFKYLKECSIEIDEEEFKFQLQSHPNFPSLYSFSEAFNFFKIANLAAEIPKEKLDLLPKKFLGFIDNENGKSLTFIKRDKDFFYYLENKNFKKLDRNEFLEKWDGVLLIIDPLFEGKETLSKRKKNNTLFSYLFILSAFIYIIFNSLSISIITLIILSFFGFFLSIEAFRQKFELKTTVASKFCGLVTSSENCINVIKTEKKILINFSDLGIVYFSAQFALAFFSTFSNFINSFIFFTKISLLIGSIAILYSLYIQTIVEKKWCIICISIIGILIGQGLIAFNLSSEINDYKSILFFGIICVLFYSVIFLFWNGIKKISIQNSILKKEKIESTKFKRTYSLFFNSLKESNRLEISNGYNEIILGNKSSNLKISLMTNPFCSNCLLAHEIIEKILIDFKEKVCVEIIFNVMPNEVDIDSKRLHLKLIEIYLKKGQIEFMHALGKWFEVKNIDMWTNVYGNYNEKNIEVLLDLLQKQVHSNRKNKILFTPSIFINGYQYPIFYNIKDLNYFVPELLEESRLI